MPDIWVGPVETAAHLKEKWFIAFSRSARRAGLPRKAVKVTVLTVKVRARGRQGRWLTLGPRSRTGGVKVKARSPHQFIIS